MPTYRANVTDKQQGDVESASDDSADRFMWFDGKQEQTGQVKAVSAYDLQAQGNAGGTTSSVNKLFPSTGMVIGSHNDKPTRFENPGKA